MKLYQYPGCNSCRNAVKFLSSKGIDFTSIDITLRPPTRKELKTMLASYDGELRKLFNTSGVQYRELKMKEKLPGMDSNAAIDLLASNGKLIKRPFLLRDKHDAKKGRAGIVGFNEADWQDFVR